MNCPAASKEPADRLETLIAAEIDAFRRFADLLRAEHQALTEGGMEQLPMLASAKEEAALRLKQIAGERNDALRALGYATDSPGMEAWRTNHPEKTNVTHAWATLLEEAEAAREINRLNGDLIKIHMDYNSRALELLRHGENPLELYGPDGQSTKHGIKRINDAA